MKIIYDVAISLIANIFSAVIIALMGYLVFIVKNSVYSNIFRKYISPKERVLETGVYKICEIKRLDNTNFSSPVPPKIKELFVDLYQERNCTELYNNSAIRIDELDKNGMLTISKVDFYDFITTNLTAYTSNSPAKSFGNMVYTVFKYFKLFSSAQEVKNSIRLKIGKNPDFKKVLSVNELANIAAVNILIEDKVGDVVLVKRSKRAAVSSGDFSVSVCGTPSVEDFDKEDPFAECATRKIREEIGVDISKERLEFKTVVISKQKMQPIFLYTAKLDEEWKNYYEYMSKSEKFKLKNEKFYVVPRKSVMKFARKKIMPDESAYQLWRYYSESKDKKTV